MVDYLGAVMMLAYKVLRLCQLSRGNKRALRLLWFQCQLVYFITMWSWSSYLVSLSVFSHLDYGRNSNLILQLPCVCIWK